MGSNGSDLKEMMGRSGLVTGQGRIMDVGEGWTIWTVDQVRSTVRMGHDGTTSFGTSVRLGPIGPGKGMFELG